MNRYRKTQRGGGLFSAIEHEQAVAAKSTGILKLRDLIPWESFRVLLEELTGYDKRDWSKGGKPPFDRTSFKNFLGLRIGDDIPDAKTLWDFKQRIEEDGREGSRKLFEAFGSIIEGKGLIAREGSIVDASFVEAPRQRNDREQNQSIKEGKRPEEFDANPAVGRQKDSEAHLIQLDAEEFLMRKGTRGQPLSEEEKQTNHTISRMRVRVEHIFARMAQMGADWCRSIGLKRATQHNHLSNLVYNMDRYACLVR